MSWLKSAVVAAVFWVFMTGLIWVMAAVPYAAPVVLGLALFGISVAFVHAVSRHNDKDPW